MINYVSNLCSCTGEQYQPYRQPRGGGYGWNYFCKGCGLMLGFRKMDEYYWTLPDSGPIPIEEASTPYHKDKVWS